MVSSTEEQLSECREVFCYFDSKGDERIGVAQVGDVLRALGQNPTDAEIRKCCAHWTDPDTRITFEDFVPIYQSVNKSKENHTLEEFVEGLSHFDKEGNGLINVAELRHLLTTLGERLSDEEVRFFCRTEAYRFDSIHIWKSPAVKQEKILFAGHIFWIKFYRI
ncbi:unnamed protein product [Toxocara canis]|uniref:Myosin-2 essential light chain n=1 Tax=Toxocara canis TaxID=6265 RepID=A0A183TYW4_TOXCA|nr:unnamed protein product [Toxocara canis]